MARDLRYFQNILEKDFPGELLIISEEKGIFNLTGCECTALLTRLKNLGKFPAVIFENATALDGKRWPGRVIFSELGTWSKIAASMDMEPSQVKVPEIIQKVYHRGKNPIPTIKITREEAPVKHTIWRGEMVSHMNLPAYRKDSEDAKPGWLCGIAVAKDINSGRYNCSWHRHLVLNQFRSSVQVRFRHLWDYMLSYRDAGFEEMPVAFVYGHHPAFMIAAGIKVGLDIDEFEFAGGLIGEPLRIVPSETLGSDFMVPADAEVVVEGYIHLYDKDFNGPWTDWLLNYACQTLEPVFRPTAVTMRENPIFSENWVGYDLLGDIGVIAEVYLALIKRYPRVKAVNFLAPFTYVVQYKPQFPGEVNRLAAYALGALGDLIINLIVVDEDINPFDPSMVFYSIGTRTDASTSQVQIIKDLWANRHDPAPEKFLRAGGLIIDSTIPPGVPVPGLGHPPEEVMNRIKLENYLSVDNLSKISIGKIGYSE